MNQWDIGTKITLNHRSFFSTMAAVRKPTLLILDEAQRLGDKAIHHQQRQIITDVLTNFHNDRLKKGLFLAGGLGTTSKILEDYHISRIGDKNYIPLFPIDKQAERAIIKDWIIKEAGADKNIKRWIDEIIRETHGWAQHITNYGIEIFNNLKENKGILSETGLKKVLREGLKSRCRYYEKRLKSFAEKEREVVADFLENHQKIHQEEVILFFKSHEFIKNPEELFERLLERGVFHPLSGGSYSTPIPSMRGWLLSNYGRKNDLEKGPN